MKSVFNTLLVLEALADCQPIGVGELSRLMRLPKTNVQRALWVLADAGWIRPAGTESTRWVLTTKALTIGGKAGEQFGIKAIALPFMERLRAEYNETTNLSIFEDDFAVLVERLDSTRPVRTFSPLGRRVPIHTTAAGKCILAHLSPEARENYLKEKVADERGDLPVDQEALAAYFQEIRDRGFAFGQSNAEVASVASAIVVSTSEEAASGPTVLGALSVSGPVSRLDVTRLLELAPAVRSSAIEISRLVSKQ